MTERFEIPTPPPKRKIPCEFSLAFALGGWTTFTKAFLGILRKKYGADVALKMYDEMLRIDGLAEKFTQTILNIFKLNENNAATIGEFFDIWWEVCGAEYVTFDRSETISSHKITKCPWQTNPKDISDHNLIICNIVSKSINPRATVKRPKAMCAGDSYCEYTFTLETDEEANLVNKLETPRILPNRSIPCELKLDIALGGYTTFTKGFLCIINKKYGSDVALKMYDEVLRIDDLLANFTQTILNVFKLKGKNAATIGEFFDIWWEMCGTEGVIFERSKTISSHKLTKCVWQANPKEVPSDFSFNFCESVAKAINPKATLERPKAKCARDDPYCIYIFRIEE